MAQIAFADAKRVALVIGNSSYSDLPNLKNPARDATAIADELARLGFTAYLVTDVKQNELDRALDIFQSKAQFAEVALVFFAGHASSVGDQNFLFSTDFTSSTTEGLNNTVSIARLQNRLRSIGDTQLLFVDACQNGLTLFKDGNSIERQVFQPLLPPENMLVSYASSFGAAAHDGTGNHSLFAGALLDYMATPNMDVEIMLRHVARATFVSSQGRQKPVVLSNLNNGIVLNLDPNQPVPLSEGPNMRSETHQGFGNKSVLLETKNGIDAPKFLPPQRTKHQEIIGNLCAAISNPKPKICLNGRS
ncbi:MAG: caspase family protein [Pseudomonadota bacterium]